MDPHGYHRVWYKWAFFNDGDVCDPYIDCLNSLTMDGSEEPFFYSTFQTLTDFYTMEE